MGEAGQGPERFALIAERRLPVMSAVSIGNGGGAAQGSERGLEYDTMSGRYREFVERAALEPIDEDHAPSLFTRPHQLDTRVSREWISRRGLRCSGAGRPSLELPRLWLEAARALALFPRSSRRRARLLQMPRNCSERIEQRTV